MTPEPGSVPDLDHGLSADVMDAYEVYDDSMEITAIETDGDPDDYSDEDEDE